MSIARCVSKLMDRIAPLSLAEKWDNVSFLFLSISPLSIPPTLTVIPTGRTAARSSRFTSHVDDLRLKPPS
jgi:hypothetical protein